MKKKLQIVRSIFAFILFMVFVYPNISVSETTGIGHSKNFRDDFSTQSIKPEWRIVDKDIDRYSLIDNQYLMLVSKNPPVNYFVFDTTDLPDNFLAEIKIDDVPIHSGQAFSFAIKQDSENAIGLFLYVAHEIEDNNFTPLYWKIMFIKKLKGETTLYGPVHILESEGRSREKVITKYNSVRLAIRRNEVEYTGSFSVGNGSWHEVGSHLFINLKGNLRFAAVNWLEDNVPESPVKVDYFEFKELE